jgi:hypothetical protein
LFGPPKFPEMNDFSARASFSASTLLCVCQRVPCVCATQDDVDKT